MRVEILGQERRRRWREEDKLAIVMSVGVAGATITEVAHRHDLTRQQIYAWRSELKKKGLLPVSSNALFIPVDLLHADDTPIRVLDRSLRDKGVGQGCEEGQDLDVCPRSVSMGGDFPARCSLLFCS
jgi:hypothetical protein